MAQEDLSIPAKAGVSRDDAAILADALVAADLSGTGTHGVSRLGIYVRRIRAGVIAPKADLLITGQRAATLSIDAGNGLGHYRLQAMPKRSTLIDAHVPASLAGIAVVRSSATANTSVHSPTIAITPPSKT